MLLAILVEQEPIKLAPSSSQIPALLAKTKQNIFDVRAQQQASQRYQQQRLQQQRPGSGTTAAVRDVPMGDPLQRGVSQAGVPGPPSLLATASGIGVAGDAPQENAPQQGVYVPTFLVPPPPLLPLFSAFFHRNS